jgi:hypothetical protein
LTKQAKTTTEPRKMEQIRLFTLKHDLLKISVDIRTTTTVIIIIIIIIIMTR